VGRGNKRRQKEKGYVYALRKSRRKRMRAGMEELRVMKAEITETDAFNLFFRSNLPSFYDSFPLFPTIVPLLPYVCVCSSQS